jgi:hypothetical protein
VTHQDWQAQLEAERYAMAVQALNNCAKAGADIESLRVLAREAGIDITHTVLGDRIKVKG